jgi:hypothetical protein
LSPFSRLFGFLVFSSVVTVGVTGCATQTGEEEADSSESDLTGARSVSLKYEGTCAFLKNCSSYSKNLPANSVSWGCTGVGLCSDSALWVAGPNRSYCGKTVKICKGSTCTNALVKDVSVSRDWEASNGVLDALDLPHGLTGKCSGFGGGKVTVEVGARAAADDDPPPTTSGGGNTNGDTDGGTEPGAGKGDNGCLSATLGEDVPELTCVRNRNGVVFQCKAGLWYRGVEGTTGPYGECDSGQIRTK